MLEVLYLRACTEPAMNQVWREGSGYGSGLKASTDLMALIYSCVDDILSHIPRHDGDINGYRAEVLMTTALCVCRTGSFPLGLVIL